MLSAYRNHSNEAEEGLNALRAEAPGSLDAIEAVGILAAWRGQARHAEEQFLDVLGEQPDRLESRLGLGNVRLDRGDASLLRQVVDEQKADFPNRRSVRESQRRLELHDSYYMVAGASFSGDQDAVAGNRVREYDLRVYSKPSENDHWRAFGRYRNLRSGPTVSTAANNIGAGLKYTVVDWTTEIEVGNRGYARLETAHALSDQWSSALAIEKNVLFRQARAVENGIKSDTANFSLRWRHNENLDVGGGFRATSFTDNRRSEAYLTANKGLYTDHDRRLTTSVRIANQRNSNPAVAYFSPEQQLEISGTVVLEFRQWQDIATKKSSLWHRIWGTGGKVHQSGYVARSMSSFGYGQEIALTDAFRIRWSIARTRYPFDGIHSSYYVGNIGFEGYF